jgi:type IV pilus assembly protein PilP
LLCSCGTKKKAPKKVATPRPVPVAQDVQVMGQSEVQEPETKKSAPYFGYNPIGKRDPFHPYISEEGPARPILTPLQTFDIDQLNLVAIIWNPKEQRAMVEDPQDRGYILKKGTLIGKNWGRVIKIEKEEVIIAEEYRDLNGQLIVNEIVMTLDEKE